eukprot:CAMPEP_0181168180 /NCGR_PEP_ID=MMETSP1096-20121128/126_1 /TAXON_ID=156174 ORGANISM="Chrysochromulina ericina, Strain CCMP281" /NCGR_SAMPLE_ID=MMETSP1096 /ASSEMBLY_ACC=CAM_ASM_000453 /LENGTH=76 /DNA_ID=CAMNT_0023255519 /DNA_START=876 /DNA_END=1103 /DNA_ORIENTATION=-
MRCGRALPSARVAFAGLHRLQHESFLHQCSVQKGVCLVVRLPIWERVATATSGQPHNIPLQHPVRATRGWTSRQFD